MLLCDGHAAPAKRELYWIDSPGTRDERGATTPLCHRRPCLRRARQDVAELGGQELELVTLTRPVAPSAAAMAVAA